MLLKTRRTGARRRGGSAGVDGGVGRRRDNAASNRRTWKKPEGK
jgi:hypothetical protein